MEPLNNGHTDHYVHYRDCPLWEAKMNCHYIPWYIKMCPLSEVPLYSIQGLCMYASVKSFPYQWVRAIGVTVVIFLDWSDQVFLPLAKTGFRQMTQGLLSDTFLETHVSTHLNLQLRLLPLPFLPLPPHHLFIEIRHHLQ